MAKLQKETDRVIGQESAMDAGQIAQENAGAALATVVYSVGRDLYYVADRLEATKCWLSVAVLRDGEPNTEGPHPAVLAGVRCADGAGWRRAYSFDWSAVAPGFESTLPVADPLVVDYAVAPIAAERKV